jgi:Fe2+ transport system protein FeoA
MHDKTPRSLSDLPAGKSAVITELQGGKRFVNRLTSLGFTAGTRVVMVQNYRHGPVIALVRGIRVALGRTASSKIRVEQRNYDQG